MLALLACSVLLVAGCEEVRYADGFYGLSGEIWSERLCETGDSYEVKVNCENEEGECLLEHVDEALVTFPGGRRQVALIEEFTGDMRRYAVHGPPAAGFPPSGDYIFTITLDTGEEINFAVEYELDYIGCVSEMSVERCENDLCFTWTPPTEIPDDAWTMLIVYGNAKAAVEVDPHARAGRIQTPPFSDGQTYAAAIAYYFDAGWSKRTVEFVW
ncbi:MAG: hypothetical protein KAY32_09545 [Candidatus Eisenbacteria sp.]|nr:hypothetical protein [Candidatus Eisenbacteria bacterium]